jgi:hypothetical protein
MPPVPLEIWRNAATVASASIALAAFFRPELQKLFARFRGRLLIYPVGERIEIGLSHAGATIGIEIVLRARSRDFFVRDGTVEVIRQRDGSRHFFSWAAFRPPNLVFGVPQQITLEVPVGFLLEPKSPRRLNIAFQDRVLQEEIESALSPLRERWSSKLREAGIFPPPTAAGNDAEQKITIDELYDDFSKEADFIQAWTALQRSCYWQPGSYLATILFNATEPEQVFKFTCGFDLSQTDSDRLHANAIPILRQNVGLRDANLSFANPKFQTPQPTTT